MINKWIQCRSHFSYDSNDSKNNYNRDNGNGDASIEIMRMERNYLVVMHMVTEKQHQEGYCIKEINNNQTGSRPYQ